VHTAHVIIERFPDGFVPVIDRKVVDDLPLIVQRIEFFILVAGQPVVKPDFYLVPPFRYDALFLQHTIAHIFENSYLKICMFSDSTFSTKILMPVCIRVICCKVVMEHQLQEFIELRVCSDIGVQNVCDRVFLTIAWHRVILSYDWRFYLAGTYFGVRRG